MKYTIYKTTNNLDGMFYIGKHQTSNPNDSYFGSGIRLRRAIKKYGKQNFSKEVLFIFDNEDDMNQKEIELVNEELIQDPKTYNIHLGGVGGFSKEDSMKGYESFIANCTKEQLSEFSKKGGKKLKEIGYDFAAAGRKGRGVKKSPRTDEHRKNLSKSLKGRSNPTKGKKHSYPKTRKKRKSVTYQTVTCNKCGKTGSIIGMKRWHFDNCKN